MFRKIISIASNLIRVSFKDKSSILWLFVMPIIWTTLIGAVSSFGSSGSSKIPIAIINSDKGIYGDIYEDVMKNEKDLDIILYSEENFKNVVNMVKETKIASMIYIPENFSDSIINNSDVNITIYKSSSNNSFYIEELVKKITNQIDISSLTGHFVLKNIEKTIILNDLDKKKYFESSFNEALKELTLNNKVSVEYEILSVQKENLILPTGFNATSPGFGVMFVMMGAFFTAVVLAEEREMNILSRLLTTPITKIVVLSGKLLGVFCVTIIQFLFIIFFGQFILGVNWGNSPLSVLLIAISFTLSAVGLGTILSSIVKTSAQASALTILISIVTSMIGGAWWPIEIMPKYLQNIAKFTPQYWAINGFNKIILRGFGLKEIMPNFSILIIYAIVSLLIASIFFRYE
ncbi:MAG TPA: ABC transporter permease [Caldisericia bacterium]|nr:ABC transporter permease [Caldisericia bacterium]HPB33258.1 ABC transporter permease [Caldisericia bacterium]HQL66426.1 ABC transporter permease [Caldisericia bacterium]HQN47897.1 ABC transporter permease [Caldisericia bacterium]HQO99937.1 ABC transporter permease [Caldisericia bacterium]